MVDAKKFEKLFSTPMMRFEVPDSVVLNAALLHEGEKMRDEDEGVSKSNRGGWHSKGNLFDRDAPCIQTLRNAAKSAVFELTRKVSKKVDPNELRLKLFGWMNSNPSGGYNAPHTHPGAHWSGVYYISQPRIDEGSSGMVEFIDPRNELPHWRILKASTFRSKKSIRPVAGEMILFPSYLIHWVHPNQSPEDRITVAFNATFSRSKPDAPN